MDTNAPTRKNISLKNLFLDPNNYRLIDHKLYSSVSPGLESDIDVQKRTMSIICGEKQQNISDLLASFKENGYLPVDQIQVRSLGDNKWLVIEGNRRIATLKYLENQNNVYGEDIGKITKELFSNVPVIEYADADPDHYMTLMALKHISGTKKWGERNQAEFLYDLHHKNKLSEDDICARIGMSKIALRQNLRALSLVKQYKDSEYGDQFNDAMFAMFREIVRNSALKAWLHWDDEKYCAQNHNNINALFSLMSEDIIEEESDENNAGYDTEKLEPALTKRNEIRQLSEFISDTIAIEYLIRNRNLNAAYLRSTAVASDQVNNIVASLESDLQLLKSFRIDTNHLVTVEKQIEILTNIIDDNQKSIDGVKLAYDTLSLPNEAKLTSIKIPQYRCFSNFEISEFSQINIFAGTNNSGKTSLLEAIYLLFRQNDANALFELVNRRGKISDRQINFSWGIKQISNCQIKGTVGKYECGYSLTKGKENDYYTDEYLDSIEIDAFCDNVQQNNAVRVFADKIESNTNSVRAIKNIIFNTPFYCNEHFRYRRYYLTCEENKCLDRIIDFMKSNVTPDIEKIYWDDEDRRFKVSDSKFPKAIDLSQYGEGMQRIFLMALLFAAAKNGILLVDEFENAIHASLLGKFANFIHQMTKEFNVQLFITSHSKECIDAFVTNIAEQSMQDFMFCGLVKNADSVVPRILTGSEFHEMLNIADIDIRKAK